MKQLIKLNTIPLLTAGDYITYKGAVTLLLTKNSIDNKDPLFLYANKIMDKINEDIINYSKEISSETRDELMLRIYLRRNKLNKKIIKHMIRINKSYLPSSASSKVSTI